MPKRKNPRKPDKKEIRQIQLVAREGVLTEILETWDFPTDNHRKVIQLLHQETLDEMKRLGLEQMEGDDDCCE